MIGVAWVRAVRSFRNAVVPVAGPVRTRHKGVINTTSPLTIYLDGGTVSVPAHCLAGYTPVVADKQHLYLVGYASVFLAIMLVVPRGHPAFDRGPP